MTKSQQGTSCFRDITEQHTSPTGSDQQGGGPQTESPYLPLLPQVVWSQHPVALSVALRRCDHYHTNAI